VVAVSIAPLRGAVAAELAIWGSKSMSNSSRVFACQAKIIELMAIAFARNPEKTISESNPFLSFELTRTSPDFAQLQYRALVRDLTAKSAG
jgi:hypothetical protein